MKQKSFSLAALIGLMSLTGQPVAQSHGVKNDAIHQKITTPKTVTANRNAFGGFSGSSDKPSRFLNQRQYRKHCRQNPCLYKSKTHRKNN